MKSTVRYAAFAMEFAKDTPPLIRNVFAVSWTAEALKVLRQIRDEATNRVKEKDENAFEHLPFANLRAQLQLEIDDWAAVRDDIGLRSLYVPTGDPDVWGFLTSDDARDVVQKIKDAFARWSEGPLARYSESRGAHTLGISALRRLNQEDKVVRISPSRVQIFPWGGISKPDSPTPFDVTAGVLAAHMAGHELFPRLGPVVRVIGGSERNSAEVMTRPYDAAGGRFSLVCEITTETLPGATQPLIYCRFKRRRWADRVNDGYAASSSIGGFVFPHAARPRSAYRFSVIRHGGKWTTDRGYPHYEYAFNLAPGYDDERVLIYPCDERASIVVMVKAGVTDHSLSELQGGVPLVDQADAFQCITEVMYELGLRPFRDFHSVKAVSFKVPALSMLRAEVTLAHLLDRHEIDENDELSAEEALESLTTAPTEHWFKSGIPTPDPEYDKVIKAIRSLTADTAYRADNTRHTIYVVSQVPKDIEWIKTTANAMLGDTIKVISVPLPANTHGPKLHLPGADERSKQRFDARMREWLKFANAVGIPERAMVLVQAPQFYSVGGEKPKPDDKVNKLAGRKALASIGCTVQYLLPSNHGRLDKFLPRVQAALLDLVFGHAGSVWGLRQACSACFGGSSPAPRWVGAIGSLYVHTEWADRPQSVFVATKLECATGQAWVRFAHQGAEAIQTNWMRFDEGAKYLVAGRFELPRPWADQRALLARFIVTTFDQMAAHDRNAVMFIDSTRVARLASWLSDSGVLDEKRPITQGIAATERWPTLRLLRIREQAPSIGQEKLFEATSTDGNPLSTWTSTQRLFEVRGTAAPTFWSLARPSTHHKRGASCYREIMLPNSKKTEEKPADFTVFPAQPDKQHLNSHAIEIVILQKQTDDDDVQLASFAQHLRAGMLTARNERWVTTPSPLRIIDKLAEYMKA
ncbi:MAG: DUF3893 domain-containing protein [Betaproteobacteria bacterium]|nr:DUF3893 domain-containing protein [Betaproteobacteria bacterium]